MTISDILFNDFDEQAAPHIILILGRLMALETLVDFLWTDKLAKLDNPVLEAEVLKDRALELVNYDPNDPLQKAAYDALESRFDAIINRVSSL